MDRLTVIWLIIHLILFAHVQTLSTSLTISPNKRYIQTGSSSITITNTSISPIVSTVTYSYATASSPKLGFSVIDSLNYQFYNNLIDVSLAISNLTQVSLQTTLTSGSLARILNFKIRYYIAQPQYGGLPTFSSYSGNSIISRNITTSNPYTYTFTGLTNVINMVGGVITFFSFTGITANSWSSNAIDLSLNIVQLTATSVSVTISVVSTTTYVTQVSYVWMSFNNLDVNKNNYASFTLQKISATNGANLGYSSVSPIIYDFNTIVGLTTLKFSGQTNFQFNTNIVSNLKLEVIAPYGFTRLDYNLLIVQTYYCKYDTPYLSNTLCYDTCPERTYAVDSQLLCNTCPYDCYTCNNNGLCLSCNFTNDFRQLNSTSSRCVPIVSYYESGVTIAGKCASMCTVCTNSVSNCSGCIAGYFLNGNSCQPCMLNCVSCNNSTSCNSCITNYVYNSSQGLCELPCSTGCSSCVNLPSNCTACTSFFYLHGTTCLKCLANCISCTVSTSCNSCNTGYSLSANGTACIQQMGSSDPSKSGQITSNSNPMIVTKQSSLTISVIIAIILAVVTFVVLIIVGLWIYRKIRSKISPLLPKCNRHDKCNSKQEILKLQCGNFICQRCLIEEVNKLKNEEIPNDVFKKEDITIDVFKKEKIFNYSCCFKCQKQRCFKSGQDPRQKYVYKVIINSGGLQLKELKFGDIYTEQNESHGALREQAQQIHHQNQEQDVFQLKDNSKEQNEFQEELIENAQRAQQIYHKKQEVEE